MLERKIFSLYRQLCLWENPICNECKRTDDLNGPISIWHVGKNYESDRYRLVFVGKTAIGGHEEEYQTHLAQNGFIDWTEWANGAIKNYPTTYWTYTRAIIEQIFGSVENGWDRIAFTNLVKCNNGSSNDTTSPKVATNCLDKLQVVWKELDILTPKNVIFYTHVWYDPFIERWTSKFECRDLTARDYWRKNGAKRLYWWERDCLTGGIKQLRLLRTSHPGRQGKTLFVSSIADWVQQNPG